MKKVLINLSLLSGLVLGGCAAPRVAYVDPNAASALNTNFSQNDLRTVAQDMASQLIQSGKINKCKSYTISPIKNKTDQYVDTTVMGNALADQLSNSAAVTSDYVLSTNEMQNQVDELDRQNQSGLYDQGTTAKIGKMHGAQCRVDGSLTSDTQTSLDGKTSLTAYTFFVQVFDVQKGVAVWRNSKNISKGVAR